MTKTLKAGDIVRVYCKPLTGEDFEGEAKLIKKIFTWDYSHIEDWEVKFLDDKDEGTFRRTINPDNC